MPAQNNSARPSPFIWSLSSGYFALGVVSLSVVGLLEPMVADLRVSRVEIAFLVTFFELAYGLAALGMQMIVGHLDRRKLILTGLFLMFAACFAVSISTSYPLVAASRILMALGAALVRPMVSAAVISGITYEAFGAG